MPELPILVLLTFFLGDISCEYIFIVLFDACLICLFNTIKLLINDLGPKNTFNSGVCIYFIEAV